jgi:hypothetical protein
VSGLSSEQLAERAVRSSEMTLGGMLKHLAFVEDDWFQVKFLGRPEVEPWASAPFDVDRDWDRHSAVEDTPQDLRRFYDAACGRSRAAVVEVGVISTGCRSRLILRRADGSHCAGFDSPDRETARHNGHVDLIREAIDGSVGE